MPKKLVKLLISQHDDLRRDVQAILSKKPNAKNGTKVLQSLLAKFDTDFREHLTLEDTVFYIELLKIMETRHEDTVATKKFIEEMRKISRQVFDFLEQYTDVKNIEADRQVFFTKFKHVADILYLRLESEESGVYEYYDIIA